MNELELKCELAVTLFQQERLTLAQASRLAEMSQLSFQAVLADRQIPIHYGVAEFLEDMRNVAPGTAITENRDVGFALSSWRRRADEY